MSLPERETSALRAQASDPYERASFSPTLRQKLGSVFLGGVSAVLAPACVAPDAASAGDLARFNTSVNAEGTAPGSEAFLNTAGESRIRELIRSELELREPGSLHTEREKLVQEVLESILTRMDQDNGFANIFGQSIGSWQPEATRMRAEMLDPVVRLSGPASVGSGVIVYSGPGPGGQLNDTLIVTNWHVIRDNQSDSSNPIDPIDVELFQGVTCEQLQAEVLDFNSLHDLALVRIRTGKTFTAARVATTEEAATLQAFDWVAAIGCPLGDEPYPTVGLIGDPDHDLNGQLHLEISAPTYVGNSGGGVFDLATGKLVGVFKSIYSHGSLRSTLIPHMGLAATMEDVGAFFEKNGLEIQSDGTTVLRQPASALVANRK